MIHRYRSSNLFFILISCFSFALKSQPYAPAAGQAGTSAIHKDSVAFVNWAKACRITRGYQDISNISLGLASVGDSSMATGKAMTNGVVSLGDGGMAVCTFENPIKDGNGFDFAVFENGFNDSFLELAFVEVSSDGISFFRFASHSLSDTVNQFNNAAVMDPAKINNLAGKYRAAYGTPFDLLELAGKQGLNIDAVTHVRIIDVVGSLIKAYAGFDSYGNKINDPWSTPFPSGGFDLDAVGVIHQSTVTGLMNNSGDETLSVFPNPVIKNESIELKGNFKITGFEVIDYSGKIILSGAGENVAILGLETGIYILKIATVNGSQLKKIIVQ